MTKPKTYCGICKRHETEDRNVLCGRDEQCSKCEGIDIGYSKCLADIGKEINQRKEYLKTHLRFNDNLKENEKEQFYARINECKELEQFLKSKEN